MSLAEFSEAERADVRTRMTRFLRGAGVELGPGHIPMPLVLPGVKVSYVDRWEPEENRELFPELGVADFPQPDIVADLDRDGLSALGKHSQDFVIASHVLEHLANPLAMLAEIYRVLRPGGVTLIFLPDRRRTFDARRAPTPLEHLVAENADGVTSVSDEHIEEFLRGVGDWDDGWTPAERARQLEVHRRRSIHVHCWSQDEFLPVIEHTVTDMGMQWELLDASFTEDFDGGFEFGFALRRS